MANDTPRQLTYARTMRKNPTWGELRLWQALRRSQFGVKGPTQEPIGPYVPTRVPSQPPDCGSGRITHGFAIMPTPSDSDQWFRERGWVVLHFDDDEVNKHLDDVLMAIRHALAKHP